MRITHVLSAALGAALALAAPLGGPADAGDAASARPVLVELFTSQGCSSCPPADALLGRLAEREGVIALSLHVDYWDYLGWRDTFADPQNTERQYAYRDALETRVVYTPQVVVQGRAHAVGTRAREIEGLIAASRVAEPGATVVVAPADGGGFTARVAPVAGGEGARSGELWAAIYSPAETVQVERGENRGRLLTYHNVVRDLHMIAAWDGTGAQSFDLPRPGTGEGVAVWLQEAGTGPVRAAAHWQP